MTMTMQESPRLLTFEQVARELNVSEDTVRRYVAAGELERIRLPGRSVRVAADALDEFIAARRGGGERAEA